MKKIVALCCLLASGLVSAEPVDFSLLGLDGETHKLSDYRGKWVIVNYWATWCPPCIEEIPDLVDFHEQHHSKDAVVLGVNFETIGLQQLRAFVDKLSITYPILRGDESPVTPLGTIPGLPTTIIVSPAGVPVARQEGPVTKAALEDFIKRKTESSASK